MNACGFLLYLLITFVVSLAYGTNFSIFDLLEFYGYDGALVGNVMASGVIATIIFFAVSNFISKKLDTLAFIIISISSILFSMLLFSMAKESYGLVCVGGFFLGLGWTIFFLHTPIYLMHAIPTTKRFRYLAYLSGGQMAGVGAASVLFKPASEAMSSYTSVFLILFVLCSLSIPFLLFLNKMVAQNDQSIRLSNYISLKQAKKIIFSRSLIPMLMITLLACCFSGLTSFQAMYAKSRNFDPKMYFLCFTITCIVSRFFIISYIKNVNKVNRILIFLGITLASFICFLLNKSSSNLYLMSASLFSLGYSLMYALLHDISISLEVLCENKINATSHFFSFFYFLGLFGFPFIGGILVMRFGVDEMLIVLICFLILAFFLAVKMLSFSEIYSSYAQEQ